MSSFNVYITCAYITSFNVYIKCHLIYTLNVCTSNNGYIIWCHTHSNAFKGSNKSNINQCIHLMSFNVYIKCVYFINDVHTFKH